MGVKAALFDLDGTLLNTLDDLTDSVNEFLRRNGFPERTPEEIRAYLGNGAGELLQSALPSRVSEPQLTEYLAQYKEIYARNMERGTNPYPGIVEMLGGLKCRGIKAGVISNKPDWATRKLASQAFGDLLDFVLGDRPGSIRRKPDPEPLELAMKELQVDPKETIYVGDSEVDIEAAKNTGLEGISVSWGFRDREELEKEQPDHLVDTPEELLAVIDTLS